MSKQIGITVFTPTYNRGNIIEDLYQSLKRQTYKNFEWIVVDDGSQDNTDEVIEKFKDEKYINIRYIKKENGGKHTATNVGIELAEGEMFITIDSDDILTDNGLEIIMNKWETVEQKSNTCGIMALYSYKNGKIVGSKFPQENLRASYTKLYTKHKVKGDKGIAFKTETLKKEKYPEFEGIKFITECVVWHEISKTQEFETVNEPIAIIEYLEDGYTKNCLKAHMIKGMVYSYIYMINSKTVLFKISPYLWFKNYVMIVKHDNLSKEKAYMKLERLSDKIMYLIAFPIGWALYKKVQKEYDDINTNAQRGR